MMNNRERFNAIMHYENYDRMPVVHFGYWDELLEKWMQEGHITKEERMTYGDGNPTDDAINKRLGFDYGFSQQAGGANGLFPPFEHKVLERFPDVFEFEGGVEGHFKYIRIARARSCRLPRRLLRRFLRENRVKARYKTHRDISRHNENEQKSKDYPHARKHEHQALSYNSHFSVPFFLWIIRRY